MVRGQNKVLDASSQLANAYRFAIENGLPIERVQGTARRLARIMREIGALPEQMVITVKDAINLGGAGAERAAESEEHTARRAFFDKLVTLAIDEYYVSEVPALTLEARGA